MTKKDNELTLAPYAEEAYLAYAMAVVKSRALAQNSDGQKPVQRRVLFAMAELGLSHTSKHVKSARVVGEILGKYHPHGDSSVYEAMVRMAQPFVMRYPLVDGQGNFGSRDGDSAAAMRYTEARLSKYAELLLSELRKGTVDFVENYDGAFTEPKLMPSRMPFLLLNGTSGIAVGMASEIPPHNMREVGTAAIHLIENPKATLDDIMDIIKCPDFPTGGQVIATREELRQVYQTGRGPIRCRGTWVKEELAKGQWQLVINSLPYQQSVKNISMELDSLLNPSPSSGKKSITQIQANLKQLGSDLIDRVVDESNKDQEVRLVISPRTSKIDFDQLVSFLLANTSLEVNFSANMTCIGLDGKPATKGLYQLLNEWCTYRIQTVIRRTQWEVEQAERRLHVLEGRHIVFLNLDKVIKIIREAESPKESLMTEFSLSELQAEDILEMRLRQLNKLEGLKLEKEMNELKAEIARLQKLLANDKLMRKAIIKEIQQDIDTYADDRRSEWLPIEKRKQVESTVKASVMDEELTVVLSKNFWIRGYRSHTDSFSFKKEDELMSFVKTRTTQTTYVLDSTGRAYSLESSVIPSTGKTDGAPISTLITLAAGASVVGLAASQTEVLVYGAHGYGLRVSADAMASKLKAGKAFLTIKDGERAMPPLEINENAHLFIKTTDSHVLIVPVKELNLGNKGGRGQQIVSLSAGAEIEILEVLNTLDDSLNFLGRSLTKAEITKWMSSRGKKGKKSKL